MRHGTCFVDVTTTLANDHGQFHFLVGLERAARDLHRIIGAALDAGPFVEHHGFGWHRLAGLGRMVGVVQADANTFANLPHTNTEAQIQLRSRTPPSASSTPGFSWPGGPYRSSFMLNYLWLAW
jgi:hypothetical protein